jgi:hypothetical protein
MPHNAAQQRNANHTGRKPAVSQGPATTIRKVALRRYQQAPEQAKGTPGIGA